MSGKVGSYGHRPKVDEDGRPPCINKEGWEDIKKLEEPDLMVVDGRYNMIVAALGVYMML